MMKHTFLLCVSGAAMLMLVACGGGESTRPASTDVASVTVTPSAASLGVGSTTVLEVVVRNSAADTVPPVNVKWSSSDVQVARVSASGAVTAVAIGTARIAATVQGRSATATISVVPVGVASVILSPLQLRLTQGATQTVVARVVDAQGRALTGRAVQWRSSDAAVATVSSSGVVTAVGAGSASIIATSEGRNASIAVTVSAVDVGSVRISPTAVSLQVGANRQLAAEVRDADGNVLSGRAINWSTTTPSIVSVSSTGMVVGVAPGTGVVMASSGGKSTSATITVEALPSPVVVGRVTLSPATATLQSEGSGDRTVQLTAEAFAQVGAAWERIDDATFSFSSSNTSVATVSPGGLVTAGAPGRATIIATSGSQFATAEIIVEEPVAPVVIARVTVTPTAAALKYTGPSNRTLQLLAKAYSQEGSEWTPVANATFTWVSSDSRVATVSSTGLVTAIDRGITTVVVSSGGKSASAEILVTKR